MLSGLTRVVPQACGPNEAVTEVTWGSRTFVVEESANVSLNNSPTAWLAPGLAVAMEHSTTLKIDGAVDEVALVNSARAQDLLVSWWPEQLHHVSVDTESTVSVDTESTVSVITGITTDSPIDGRGVGCCFSGGVDSFYSVVKNHKNLTHLVFVHGFDIYLTNQDYYETTLKGLRRAAQDMGLILIEVRTNIRHMYEKYRGGWDLGHGVAIAHVAHLLSDHIHTLLVPASHDASNVVPYGTHPDLDPLWSSASTTLVYDGLEATRVEKALLIKDSDQAMAHLRVCFWNRTDIQNCGECEKCVRTMINMRVAGAGDRCTALPDIDELKALEWVYLDVESGLCGVQENLSGLRSLGLKDPELEAALEAALHRNLFQKLRGRVGQVRVIAKVLVMTFQEKLAKNKSSARVSSSA